MPGQARGGAEGDTSGRQTRRVQQQVVDFFSSFEEFEAAAERARAERRLAVLQRSLGRYRRLRGACLVGTPLEGHEDLQEKLCAKLHTLINEDILILREHLNILDILQEKLSNKHNSLRASCAKIDFEEDSILVRGSVVQLPLVQLLEFAHDGTVYAFHVCTQLDIILEQVALLQDNAEDIVDNLKADPGWKERVKEIIAYTASCSENKL